MTERCVAVPYLEMHVFVSHEDGDEESRIAWLCNQGHCKDLCHRIVDKDGDRYICGMKRELVVVLGEQNFCCYRISEMEAAVRNARQAKVLEWVHQAFGKDSVRQRAIRLLEEAAEAYQAAGGDETMAIRLMSYVFRRPVGDLPQELGGIGVTLLALAATAGLSADVEEQREMARVLSKPVEHFAARNAAKNAAGFKAADTE